MPLIRPIFHGMGLRRGRIQGLFIAFTAITIAILAGITFVALRAIAASHRAATDAARADLAALHDATEIQGILYQKGFAAEYFLTGDQRWLDELRQVQPAVERWIAEITQDAVTKDASEATSALIAEYGRYDAERTRAIGEYQSGAKDAATRTLVAYTERMGKLRDLADHLMQIRRREITTQLDQADRAWRTSLYGLGTVMMLAIVGAALAGFLLARRVSRPLYELVLRAESAAGGARIEVSTDDELDALSQHVTRLARQIENSSAELAEHRVRLSQAEKMSALGEMATAVAHEVLNPLTGMKAALQLLARTNHSPEIRDTVQAVDGEIRRVETIARRLTSFARPYQPHLQPCDLEEIWNRVVQATRADESASTVRFDCRLNGLRKVSADPELLTQVLVNLALNACQAMPQGGTVHFSAEEQDGWRVIEVSDEGTGIAQEIAPKLFAPFATTKNTGHGLGLAIAQNIVLAHGGRIEARTNAPAVGTTFSVSLPRSFT